MKIGVDTYIDLDSAKEYVQKHYRSTDHLRANWDALTDDDKEVLLWQSLEQIEALPFKYRKRTFQQVLAFPRQYLEIPKELGIAQVENALEILRDDIKKRTAQQEQMGDGLGLMKNIRRPTMRPRTEIGGVEQIQQTAMPRHYLTSKKAYDMIRGYLV
jgi:hypothetical protein